MRGLPPDRRGAALCRGAHTNDQAYMLARLPQHWLSRLVFPIGGYEKTQVRQLARDFGLPVAEKPDSMEICFIPDGDYAAWLEARGAVPPPGHFVDRTRPGCWAGTGYPSLYHRSAPGAGYPAAHRLFVSEIRPETQGRWSSPTARTLWRTRSGGRTLTRWPL